MCSHDVTAAMLEEQTKKRQPSWKSEIFFWGINSIFMQITPFVSLCKYGSWSHERTHSYQTYLGIYVARVTQQRLNHLRVSFVNSDMQWRAFVFVALVSICASFQQGGGCWRLITNRREKTFKWLNSDYFWPGTTHVSLATREEWKKISNKRT